MKKRIVVLFALLAGTPAFAQQTQPVCKWPQAVTLTVTTKNLPAVFAWLQNQAYDHDTWRALGQEVLPQMKAAQDAACKAPDPVKPKTTH